jgi:hypothetical protein
MGGLETMIFEFILDLSKENTSRTNDFVWNKQVELFIDFKHFIYIVLGVNLIFNLQFPCILMF